MLDPKRPRKIEFATHFDGSLEAEVSRGFSAASITKLLESSTPGVRADFAVSLVLSREDGTGLRIVSRMHDVAERFEIGTLEFHRETSLPTSPRVERIDLPRGFRNISQVSKLVIVDVVEAESGLEVVGSSGEPMHIVAGAYPFTLSIHWPGYARFEQPEYPLEQYRRSSIGV